MRFREVVVEFLALVLLAPLIWSGAEGSSDSSTSVVQENSVYVAPRTSPRIETADGRWSISPPIDTSLTMTVVEHKLNATVRGPASGETSFRRIDVIVSAP